MSAGSTAYWGSRAARRSATMQIKLKLPADSWPTAELLGRLRGAK